MKTFVAILFAGLLLAPDARAKDRITHTFAECVGRASAELEHAWLMGAANADTLEARYAALEDLLEASQKPEKVRRMLSLRIEAKLAHAALLTTGSFAEDNLVADRARRVAARYMQSCQSLLISG